MTKNNKRLIKVVEIRIKMIIQVEEVVEVVEEILQIKKKIMIDHLVPQEGNLQEEKVQRVEILATNLKIQVKKVKV